MPVNKWDKRFMELAKLVATWSKDPGTKVGACIVDPETKEVRSLGYNGFPRGVNDDVSARWERPLKYSFAEHAERNAIYNAGLSGARLRGCTMYVTFPTCNDCARAIIQSGLKRLVILRVPADKILPMWADQMKPSYEMLSEAGVAVEEI
jgi:dCMP deaminase